MITKPSIFDPAFLRSRSLDQVAADVIDWLQHSVLENDRTQSDLAYELDLEPSAVSRILSGERKLSAVELLRAHEWFESLNIPEPHPASLSTEELAAKLVVEPALQPGESIPLRPEVRRYQPDPLDRPKASAPQSRAISPAVFLAMETERDVWKAHAFLWKDRAEEQRRALAHCPTIDCADGVVTLHFIEPGHARAFFDTVSAGRPA